MKCEVIKWEGRVGVVIGVGIGDEEELSSTRGTSH